MIKSHRSPRLTVLPPPTDVPQDVAVRHILETELPPLPDPHTHTRDDVNHDRTDGRRTTTTTLEKTKKNIMNTTNTTNHTDVINDEEKTPQTKKGEKKKQKSQQKQRKFLSREEKKNVQKRSSSSSFSHKSLHLLSSYERKEKEGNPYVILISINKCVFSFLF